MSGNGKTHVLYSEDKIRKRVQELAAQIADDYKGKKPFLVGVLKGSVVLFADLLRALYREGMTDVEIDFMTISAYGKGMTYSGSSTIIHDLTRGIRGRDVLIVEDIIDTGHTLVEVKKHLLAKAPSSLKLLAFLDKVEKREADIKVDYVGFVLPGTAWIEGYGLDGGEYGRGRPDIAEKIQ